MRCKSRLLQEEVERTADSESKEVSLCSAEYRREHDLERDSTLAVIQLGEALILAPIDEMLTEITDRMEAAMRGAGVTVEELMEETSSRQS
jgi:hypothetical protein